jgi:hypothetical protein
MKRPVDDYSDAPRRSYIINCHIYVKNSDAAPYLFYAPTPGSSELGDMYVSLDGYLICPLEMFTPRQLKTALKKYRRE